jgi:hypothetical protein
VLPPLLGVPRQCRGDVINSSPLLCLDRVGLGSVIVADGVYGARQDSYSPTAGSDGFASLGMRQRAPKHKVRFLGDAKSSLGDAKSSLG